MDDDTARTLVAYVERGGKLLTSGAAIDSPILRPRWASATVRRGAVQDGHVLLQTHDEPTGVDVPGTELDAGRRGSCIRSTCPGISSTRSSGQPGEQLADARAARRAASRAGGLSRGASADGGQGADRASSAPILFTQYQPLGDPQMLRWLREIIDGMDPAPFVRTDAPSWVDVSVRRKDGALLVHLVNQNPGRGIVQTAHRRHLGG